MAGSRETGLKAAATMRKRYGKDYFKKFASSGGKARNHTEHAKLLKEKYGEDYFKQIRKGGKRAEGKNNN